MTDPKRNTASSGRYAYQGLDRLLHEKARLGILTSLTANPEGLLFNDLKSLCDLTDGNLSRHLQMLHEAELVEIDKNSLGRRPQTVCRLTAKGRQRFFDYLTVLERVVQDAAEVADSEQQSYYRSKWVSV